MGKCIKIGNQTTSFNSLFELKEFLLNNSKVVTELTRYAYKLDVVDFDNLELEPIKFTVKTEARGEITNKAKIVEINDKKTLVVKANKAKIVFQRDERSKKWFPVVNTKGDPKKYYGNINLLNIAEKLDKKYNKFKELPISKTEVKSSAITTINNTFKSDSSKVLEELSKSKKLEGTKFAVNDLIKTKKGKVIYKVNSKTKKTSKVTPVFTLTDDGIAIPTTGNEVVIQNEAFSLTTSPKNMYELANENIQVFEQIKNKIDTDLINAKNAGNVSPEAFLFLQDYLYSQILTNETYLKEGKLKNRKAVEEIKKRISETINNGC